MTVRLAAAWLALVALSGTLRAAELAPEPEPHVQRHYFGLQVGGSSPIAMTYRYRISGPVLLEVGGFGAPEALAIATTGLVAELHRTQRWVIYAGSGGSADVLGDDVLAFLYGRVGIGLRLGDRRQHQLALDVGAWWGAISKSDHETHAHVSTDRLLIPMAGLSYLVGWGG